MRWRTSLRYQYRDEPLENSDIVDKTVKKGYFVDIVVDTSIGMDRMSALLEILISGWTCQCVEH